MICVYALLNIKNEKVYVGSSFNFRKRSSEHFRKLKINQHINKHLQASFNKYGMINFVMFPLEILPTKENLLNREQFWINNLKSYDRKFGYNLYPVAGSSSGTKHSEEFKQKLSERMKGNSFARGKNLWKSYETKLKMSKARIGIKLGDETKKKLSNACKGRKHTDNELFKMRGVNHPKNKLSTIQVLSIRKDNRRICEIAKSYSLHPSTVYNIKIRKIWKHLIEEVV